ncbi:MAG: NADP-dependent phosphogluconate dehydrogenase, partial [Chrysiogenales bacterium]
DGDGEPLLDRIRDSAGEKGTGNRAVAAALDLASPATVMAEAVFARMISSRSELRARMSRDFPVTSSFAGERESVLGDLEKGVYCSAAVSCDQGFALMNAASKEYGWNLDLASVARSWRAGCIIQSEMMGEIEGVFLKSPGAATILVEEPFAGAIRDGHAGWRRVLSAALSNGVPAPALSSALACFDACRSARLPADLLQAMRDYFGVHGFERRDNPGGGTYHGEWKRSPRE